MSLYEEDLANRLNEIHPDASRCLATLGSLDPEVADRLVIELLKTACRSQNAAAITAGRNSLSKAPRTWLETPRLFDLAERAIDLEDPWEYRRMLEVISELKISSALWQQWIEFGWNSPNREIVEAANDFADHRPQEDRA